MRLLPGGADPLAGVADRLSLAVGGIAVLLELDDELGHAAARERAQRDHGHGDVQQHVQDAHDEMRVAAVHREAQPMLQHRQALHLHKASEDRLLPRALQRSEQQELRVKGGGGVRVGLHHQLHQLVRVHGLLDVPGGREQSQQLHLQGRGHDPKSQSPIGQKPRLRRILQPRDQHLLEGHARRTGGLRHALQRASLHAIEVLAQLPRDSHLFYEHEFYAPTCLH
mmetsp:Transcript_7995/g.29905  ORF Transcript_7995/g.29905 Transcript_7995/m.29905 type:complete len:225 (+) Transcript_7995:2000-2674(+)